MTLRDKFRRSAQITLHKFSIGTCTVYKSAGSYSSETGAISTPSVIMTASVPFILDEDISKYEHNKDFIGARAVLLVAGEDVVGKEAVTNVGNAVLFSDTTVWKIMARSVDMYSALHTLGITRS